MLWSVCMQAHPVPGCRVALARGRAEVVRGACPLKGGAGTELYLPYGEGKEESTRSGWPRGCGAGLSGRGPTFQSSDDML